MTESILERCLKWEVQRNAELNQLLLDRDHEIKVLQEEVQTLREKLSVATSGKTA